jgi:hypothetical protein
MKKAKLMFAPGKYRAAKTPQQKAKVQEGTRNCIQARMHCRLLPKHGKYTFCTFCKTLTWVAFAYFKQNTFTL